MRDCLHCSFVDSRTDAETREQYWLCKKNVLPGSGLIGTRLFDDRPGYGRAALQRYWSGRLWCEHWREFWLTRMLPLAFSGVALLVSIASFASKSASSADLAPQRLLVECKLGDSSLQAAGPSTSLSAMTAQRRASFPNAAMPFVRPGVCPASISYGE